MRRRAEEWRKSYWENLVQRVLTRYPASRTRHSSAVCSVREFRGWAVTSAAEAVQARSRERDSEQRVPLKGSGAIRSITVKLVQTSTVGPVLPPPLSETSSGVVCVCVWITVRGQWEERSGLLVEWNKRLLLALLWEYTRVFFSLLLSRPV